MTGSACEASDRAADRGEFDGVGLRLAPIRTRVLQAWTGGYGASHDRGRVRTRRFRPADLARHRPVPPRATGAAAQRSRPRRLDVEHRAHPRHARLPRRQLAAAQRHDAQENLADLRRHAATSRAARASPSPSSTRPTTTSSAASTCIPRPPRIDVTVQSWVRADRAGLDAHSPTPWPLARRRVAMGAPRPLRSLSDPNIRLPTHFDLGCLRHADMSQPGCSETAPRRVLFAARRTVPSRTAVPVGMVEGDVASGEAIVGDPAGLRIDLWLCSARLGPAIRGAWRYLADTGAAAYGSHGACKPNCPCSSPSREDGPAACGPRAVSPEGPFRDRARSARHTWLRRDGGRRTRAVASAWRRRRSRRRSSSSGGAGASIGPGATTCPSGSRHRTRRRREPGIPGNGGTRGPRSLRRVGGRDRPGPTRDGFC